MRNQKVFASANYVTKSDWDTALHPNVLAGAPFIFSLNFSAFLKACLRLEIKYFHCLYGALQAYNFPLIKV